MKTFLYRCPKVAEWHGASDPIVKKKASSSVTALAAQVPCPVCETLMKPVAVEESAAA